MSYSINTEFMAIGTQTSNKTMELNAVQIVSQDLPVWGGVFLKKKRCVLFMQDSELEFKTIFCMISGRVKSSTDYVMMEILKKMNKQKKKQKIKMHCHLRSILNVQYIHTV